MLENKKITMGVNDKIELFAAANSGRGFVSFYKEIFGEDILGYKNVSEALSDIIDVKGKKYNENCAVKDMVIGNLSGGYQVRDSNRVSNERTRAIVIEYLSVGDVIIAQHKNNSGITVYTGYIYLGGRDFLALTSDVGVATVTVCNAQDPTEKNKVQNILYSLYSDDKYAIIRPSMANTAE